LPAILELQGFYLVGEQRRRGNYVLFYIAKITIYFPII
jgi:hypothetical protein